MSIAGTLALPDAAAHLAMSPRAFAREVREGRLPAALPVRCRPRIWSRAVLDAWLDAQGRGPSTNRRADLLERIDEIGTGAQAGKPATRGGNSTAWGRSRSASS